MSPAGDDDVSIGELARRLDRFERETRASLESLIAMTDRRSAEYVRNDVFAQVRANQDGRMDEIDGSLKRARAIMWGMVTSILFVIIGAIAGGRLF